MDYSTLHKYSLLMDLPWTPFFQLKIALTRRDTAKGRGRAADHTDRAVVIARSMEVDRCCLIKRLSNSAGAPAKTQDTLMWPFGLALWVLCQKHVLAT